MIENYRTRNLEAMRPSWDEVRTLNRRIALVGLGVLAGYAIATATLGWAAYHHTIALGTLVVMLTMLPTTMQVGGITAADFQLETMLSAVPDLDALTENLRPPAEDAEHSEHAEPKARTKTDEETRAEILPRQEIRFDRVTFRYPGGDHNVLDELDLTLEAGESTAIVGVNGAGKTTLITLLAGLREPTSGRILVDGKPATPGHRPQTAAVFQDFTRFPLTVRENVALNLLGEPVNEDLLADVAARAGATDLIANLPLGWDTILSSQYENGQDLSGGQWQRIALARALYAVEGGAGVLVLDEPTAQLDVRAEARFYDRFLEITQGVTSIVISHRFSTVRKAGRIAVLDGGRITELGTHDELLAAGGTYAHMFTLQAARFTKTNGAQTNDARTNSAQTNDAQKTNANGTGGAR
jgi:ATP-binding cassette subfamily B protein